MRVRKAVIPAAGLGTRFLPVSRSVPKELLPVLDKPLIQYAVEEAASAGIQQIIIVSSPGKPALESYFLSHDHLEQSPKKVSPPLAQGAPRLTELPQVSFVTQEKPLGLGHAVLTAAEAVGDEPFLVLLPDDLIFNDPSGTRQLLDVFEKFDASVLAVEKVPQEVISQYGIIDGALVADRVYKVQGLVEKPDPKHAPSDMGIVGRYILTPQIFSCLRRTSPGAKGEIQLTDGVALLMEEQSVYARQLAGTRHDGGSPLGLLKASLEVALRREDTRGALLEFLSPLLTAAPRREPTR